MLNPLTEMSLEAVITACQKYVKALTTLQTLSELLLEKGKEDAAAKLVEAFEREIRKIESKLEVFSAIPIDIGFLLGGLQDEGLIDEHQFNTLREALGTIF
jgi:hypothetical protein